MPFVPAAGATAAPTEKVLILGSTVTGGASSIEATEAIAKGFAVDIVDGATWSAMTGAQFSSYRAIILGDPTCSSLDRAQPAEANAGTWGPAVNGNVVIIGSDPVFHASQGGEKVTRRGVDFALDQPGKTGAYIALSCYYHGTSARTPVPLLSGIGSGGFSVTGVGCFNNAHIVANHPALAGLSDTDVSNWSCSVHEAFDAWPGEFGVLAIAKDFDSSFTASDGTVGPPYILASGVKTFPLSVSPTKASSEPGKTHTVTAELLDGTTLKPVSSAKIGFAVTSGPNKGVAGTCSPAATCLTGSDGTVSFTYKSNGKIGNDTIQVFYDRNGNGVADPGEPQTTAGIEWGRLELVGLEVNQAVQDWNDSVPLVTDKRTMVRAFVQTKQPGTITITGRLVGTRGGSPLPGSPLAPINPGATVAARQDIASRRSAVNDSLNFRLPASWLNGTIDLRVDVPVKDNPTVSDLLCKEAAKPVANDCAATMSFQKTAAPEVEYVSIGYKSGASTIRPPTAALVEQAYRMASIYPIASLHYRTGDLIKVYGSQPSLTDVNSTLSLARLLDGCLTFFGFGCSRRYYGLLGGSDVGGLANGIPGTVASGSQGQDKGYARNRGAHEIAHTLGRSHAVNASNGLAGGLKHGYCGEVAATSAPDFPYSANLGGSTKATIGPLGVDKNSVVWGIDTRYAGSGGANADLAVIDPSNTFELMSYCGPLVASGEGRWISKYTYQALTAAFAATATAASASSVAPARAATATSYIVARGRIDTTTDAATFEPFSRLTSTTAPEAPPTGDYTLELRRADGSVASSTSFQPTEFHADTTGTGTGGTDPGQAMFLIPVADPGAVASAVVRHGPTTIGTLTASAHTPTVSVTDPAAGTSHTGDTVHIAWTGADADGDPLTYTVLYSRGGDAPFETLATDIADSQLDVPRSSIGGSSNAVVRVIVSDGFNAASSDTAPFSVANNPPSIVIAGPASGDSFVAPQSLFLDATAYDREDGALTGSAITWSSDKNGPLGTGAELVVPAATLTPGVHVIRATATDSKGQTAVAEVTVTIVGTVACTTTITGAHGTVMAASGTTCLQNAEIAGSVIVSTGASVDIENSTVSGAVNANGAATIRVCNSTISGSINISRSKGFVLIGDAGDDGCAANQLGGSLILQQNTGGLEVIGNTVAGAITASANSGAGPFPEDTAPEIEANHM